MHYLLPDYYEKFTCAAERCQDNCCIGWEIDIDDDTWSRYLAAPEPWKSRFIRQVHDVPGDRHFILQNARCPFLNQANRCEIILHLGEEALCDICDEHPRFSFDYAGWSETGLGLCCEEAARLILSQTEPAGFMSLQSPGDDPTGLPENLQQAINRRWQLFALLQHREYPLSTRLQALLQAEEAGTIPDAAELSALTAFLAEQEYLTPEWPQLLHKLARFFQSPAAEQAAFGAQQGEDFPETHIEYEQLALYFLFRHYLSAALAGAPAETVRLCVALVLLIQSAALAEYQSTGIWPDFARRLRLAQLFSKEVEYNDVALDGLKEILLLDL